MTIFRVQGLLRGAALLIAVGALTACESTNDNANALSEVAAVDVPMADTTTTVNINNPTPTLTVLDTFQVNDGDLLTLVWSDEFNGDQLDPDTWFFATGDGAEMGLPSGWGNNELQWYLPDNARLEDGRLIIEARRETVVADNANGVETAFGYTSARLNTRNRINVQYGRIEARIKLPAGQGLWPVFWMFPQTDTYGSFSASGEIDIMEAVNLGGTPGPGGAGGGNAIFGTIHFGGEFPNNQSASVQMQAPEDVTADFHNYAVEWDEFEIRWYFDGQLYAVQNAWSSTGGAYPAPFDHPFYILLNLAVGGNFPGPPNNGTPLPATMEVDWVRVFSGEDSGPPFVPADPGVVPDDVIYATDPNEMVDLVFGVDYTGFSPFGSGSTFDNNVTGDPDFSPAFGVTSGDGYGAQVGQFAIEGFAAGFAGAYESLVFKAKNLNNDLIRVKLLPEGSDPYVDIDLTTSPFSTDLGNGWYQVVLPVSQLNNVDAATTLLFETDNLAPASFTFLLTDFGFSGTAGGGGNMGGGNDGELLANGDFEASASDKAPWINAGDVTVNNFYTVQANDGGNVFDTNLSQVVDITQGQTYVLNFRARASVDRNIIAGIGLNEAPFTNTAQTVGVTTNWLPYSLTLTATDFGNANSRVLFDLGTIASTVDIDDVSLTLMGGDGSELLTNGDFQANAADKAPWINAGDVTTNNFYTVVANDGGNVFDTNLSQITNIDPANMYTLSFRARSSVVRDIIAGIGLNGGSFTAVTATASLGTDWQPFEFTLDAATLGEMQDRRVLFDMGTVASTVDIDDVSLTVVGGGMMGGGGMGQQLASNGGFETGDFSDWALTVGDGTATVTMTDPSEGASSANLTIAAPPGGATAPSTLVLQQQTIGQGVVQPGDTINISFDLKGTAANGGVVNVEFFSERAVGVDQQFLETIAAPTATYSTFTYSVTASDDVSRGVTLQFALACGAVDGCMANVDLDNVSISLPAAP